MTERRRDDLLDPVRRMLEAAWRPPGYCVPNPSVYPQQWLWDSCFHSVVWTTLGDNDRAVVELTNALANQDRETGWVPHMTYWADPSQATEFWGCRGTSSITQPPMYGHALRVAVEAGAAVDDELVEAVGRGLTHLLVDRPPTPAGLVPVYHPWETGCDDSPRWDGFGPAELSWSDVKGHLVADLAASGGVRRGVPRPVAERRLPPFVAGSVGFSSLVAWNCREYLAAAASLARQGSALGPAAIAALASLEAAIDARWDPATGTWLDDGAPSSGARTLDAMLALLVTGRDDGFDLLVDPAGLGARFGPRGVDRREPSYEADRYWRGPAWPQLTYLLGIAARRAGRDDVADRVASGLVDGAAASGLAEYWHPDTGAGLGAAPQTWAGLAIVPI